MIKRILGLILAASLTLSVSACSSGEKNTSGQQNLVSYAETEIGSNSGLKWPAGSRVNSKGQLVFFDRKDGVNSGFVTIDQNGNPVENSEISFSGDVRAFALDTKDNLHVLTIEPKSGSISQKLTVLNSKGEILNTFDLGTFSIDGGIGRGDIGYTDIAVDSKNNIYLCNPATNIQVLDKDGKPVKSFDTKGYESIDIDSDGNLIAGNFGEKRAIEKIDPTTGKNIWSADLSQNTNGSFMMGSAKVRFSGADKCIYYLSDKDIKKYDSAGKLIGTAIDFQSYAIKASGYMISDMVIDASGNIFVTSVSQPGGRVSIGAGPGPKGTDGGPTSKGSGAVPAEGGKNALPPSVNSNEPNVIVDSNTPADPNAPLPPEGADSKSEAQGPSINKGGKLDSMDIKFEVYKYAVQKGGAKAPKQEVITVSVPYSSRALEMAASRFQKDNPGYKVNIQTYTGQNNESDYEAYLKNLNTQILSGNGPDIISVAGMPFESYVSKNILADLGEMMANDKSFDLSKYYSNIFDAVKYSGKLYVLPTDFTFDVLMANQEILDQEGIKIDDSTWTWNDFKSFADKVTKKDGTRTALPSLSGYDLLNLFTSGSYKGFIDAGKKTASFTSQGFTDLLNTVKSFSSLTDSNIETDMISILEAARRGSVVFYPNNVSDYNMYAFMKSAFNEHLKLYNIPTEGGFKGGTFSSGSVFAINRNSKFKTQSWEVLKTLISDEVQSQQVGIDTRPAGPGGALKSPGGFSINKSVEQKKAERVMEETQNGNMKMAMASPNGSIELSPAKMTQTDIDYINGFISGLNKFADYDANISGIVEDETEAFFSGNKSAEDTAKLIQDRVSTYLGE